MRTNFGVIAQAMHGPRASGRTYRMIQSAPQGATLLARDNQHAEWLKEATLKHGRNDLKVHTPNGHGMAGQHGELIPDHYTIEGWLFEAEAEIQKEIEAGRELLARVDRAEAELKAIKSDFSAEL